MAYLGDEGQQHIEDNVLMFLAQLILEVIFLWLLDL